jgi:NADH-quinone oxidoreductase subunit M
MTTLPILSLLILLPALGATIIWALVRGDNDVLLAKNARSVGLWTSFVTLVFSLSLWFGFDPQTAGMQFEEQHRWFPALNLHYHIGIDGISLFFVLLTTLLTPLALLSGWDAIQTRVREYIIMFLLLESCVIGVFVALDALLFYVFFEAVLVPMYLIIGIWGGQQRVYAAFKFFLYTLAGSLLFLVAIIYLHNQFDTTDILTLAEKSPSLPLQAQRWLWLAMLASFAVKIPMWPVHTWLPDAHVQAPTAGSVILAGILLKLGGYGFLRFSLPMLPAASLYYAPWILGVSVIAIIYASLVAFAQTDMKKMIAYSSVAHMGMVTLGLFTFTEIGLAGATLTMLSHGFISAALFMCVGVLYERTHSRELADYGGVVERMPMFALCMMLFTMGSVALPGTSGFTGELMIFLGIFQVNNWVGTLATLGIVLGALYMLWLYRRVLFGAVTHSVILLLKDLALRERLMFFPLIILVLWMGIYPAPFTRIILPPLAALSAAIQRHTGDHHTINQGASR